MQQGRIVERGATAELYAQPKHNYTRALLNSAPGLQKP
jgi:peptide/nickel transport system ATP-binding protein